MKPATLIAFLFLVSTVFQQATPAPQSSSKPAAAAPKEAGTWMVLVSNVYKDPDENYGHGEGDQLTVIVHGETAVGGLSELEGSQQDPRPFAWRELSVTEFFIYKTIRPTPSTTLLRSRCREGFMKFHKVTRSMAES